jgi:hypothetical protein
LHTHPLHGPPLTPLLLLPARQVSEREAGEAARKAERQCAADRIYDKLRLEKEAALREQVRGWWRRVRGRARAS